MISGTTLRDARALANMTQQQLADRLNVALRTIVGWESRGVPENRRIRVEDALGPYLEHVYQIAWDKTPEGERQLNERGERWADDEDRKEDPIGWGVRNASDRQLVDEVLRRLGEVRAAVSDPATTISQSDYAPAASEGGDDPDEIAAAHENQP